jgi:hypothetical protein
MSFRQILSSSRTRLLAVGLVLGIAGSASPALAVPLSVGETISVSYNQPIFLLPDLAGTLDLTVQNITSTKIVLGIDIANATSSFFSSARLTGLGWDSSILPTGATDTSHVYNTFLSQNFPGNKAVNLCLSSGSNCAGGSNGGLSTGQSDLFTLTLLGDFGNSTIDFSNFAAKFQTAYGSFETSGTITAGCTGTSCGGGNGSGGGNDVPEPSTFSVLAFALLGSLGFRFAVRLRTPQQIPAAV